MILGSVSKGWLNRSGGFTFPRDYYFDPVYRRDEDYAIEEFLAEKFPDIPIYNMESNLTQPEHMPEAPLYIGGIQPNLILGALLGADLLFPEGGDPDIRAKPLTGFSGTDSLPDPKRLLSHPLIQEFTAQIERFTAVTAADTIIPPFFWDRSGRATIHGFITTSFKFVGEEIFIRAFEDPDEVAALHSWISEAYIVLIRHFSRAADLPVRGIHIGECSGTMISAQQFEELVLPNAVTMGKTLGPVRFHSCGNSDHLIELFGRIPNLHSLDTGTDTSIQKIRDLLGPDLIIEYAPPTELMMEGSSPEKIRAWLRETAEENNGGPLHIGYHFEPGYSRANIRALHDEAARLGIGSAGRPALYKG